MEYTLSLNPFLPEINTSSLRKTQSDGKIIYRGIDLKKDDAISKSLRQYMSERRTDIKHYLKPVERLSQIPLQKDMIASKIYSENKFGDDTILKTKERRREENRNKHKNKEKKEATINFVSGIRHLQQNAYISRIFFLI